MAIKFLSWPFAVSINFWISVSEKGFTSFSWWSGSDFDFDTGLEVITSSFTASSKIVF